MVLVARGGAMYRDSQNPGHQHSATSLSPGVSRGLPHVRRGGHSVKAQTAEAVRVEVAEIRVAVERATAGRAVAADVAVV